MQRKSAVMADTLKSSFQNLQTVFMSLADEKVQGPMQGLVDFMNYLSEDTSRIETGIKAVAGALGALTAVKMSAGIVSFIANLKGLKGGGIDLSGITKATGGAGMPVYVTNLGAGGLGVGTGGAGVPSAVGAPVSTGVPMLGAPSQNTAFMNGMKNMGLATVLTTAVTSAADMYMKNKAIDANEEMTEREKSKAKGGNTGEAVGRTAGTAGGVALALLMAAKGAGIGAAAGAPAAGVGAIPGAIIGGLAGLAGGIALAYAGRKAGEAIGDAVGFSKEQEALRNAKPEPAGVPQTATAGIAAPEIQEPKNRTLVSNNGWDFTEVPQVVREEVRAVSSTLPSAPIAAEITGEATMNIEMSLRDERTTASVSVVNNGTPFKYPRGSRLEVSHYE